MLLIDIMEKYMWLKFGGRREEERRGEFVFWVVFFYEVLVLVLGDYSGWIGRGVMCFLKW